MLRHSDIWRAIEPLAQEKGLSASGLARRADLFPSTFSKIKCITRDGKTRWPSTESISSKLQATGTSLGEFVTYLERDSGSVGFGTVPLIGFAQAGSKGFFDDAGYPAGSAWDEIPFPDPGDPTFLVDDIDWIARVIWSTQ